jgi:hypothetical protein
MKKLKRFNELLSEVPHQVSGDSMQTSGSDVNFENDSVIKFEEFAEHRLEGATTISNNAEEKGGDALLTHHHFVVKLPFYEEVTDGKFNPNKAQAHYEDLIEELFNRGINFEQIEFQELLGKIEVLGELLIKSKDLK